MVDYIIVFMSVVVGSFLGFTLHNKKQIGKQLLVFSGGLLLSITVLEIFPEIFHEHDHSIGLWVLLGVILQLFIESITKGMEHGHAHSHDIKTAIPYGLLAGLFIHSFLEGMPIDTSHHLDNDGHIHLSWAIAIHNIPIALVLSSILFSSKLPKLSTIIILLLFALSTPLGGLFGRGMDLSFYPKILGVVAGIFLHISSVIIFESNESHSFDLKKILTVLSGMFAGFLITLMH